MDGTPCSRGKEGGEGEERESGRERLPSPLVPFLFFSPLPLLPKWQQVRLIQRRGSITMTATDRLSGERQASSNIRPYRIGPGGRGGWSDRAAECWLMCEVYCVRLKYALLLQHSSVPCSFHCFLLQVWLLERLRRRGETKRGAEGSGVGWFCLSSVVDGSSFRGNGGEGGVGGSGGGGTSGGTNKRTID